MADRIDIRVPAGLHPDNVQSVDGYCEETKAILQPTRDVFHACYTAIGAVADARDAARSNPSWTEASQIIQTDDLARKYIEKLYPRFDSVRTKLLDGITSIERDLSAPIASKGVSSMSAEVRAHVKGLPDGERMKLVQRIINSGDEVSASAVLGGPAFLSGLTDEMHGLLTRQYHERSNPTLTVRLRAMRGAVEFIEKNGSLTNEAFTKAVGVPPHKVNALRSAKTAAEKHFVMRDLG